MDDDNVETYSTACAKYLASTGKTTLSIEDKREISRLICKSRIPVETIDNTSTIKINHKYEITIITAYSENYRVGHLCEHINRIYCGIHGYEFICHKLPQKEMEEIIMPRKHCTWYKVKMIVDILTTRLSNLSLNSNKHDHPYLFWIDSDAIVIDHSKTVESYIERGKWKDLIIAEDMSPCCLLNAGVMLIKVSSWNLSLWSDIWNCNQYFQRPFYEQAALLKCLKIRQEGLNLHVPFHTYLPGATSGDKYFPHVAVFPSIDFNTNRGFISSQPKVRRKFNRSHEKLKKREKAYIAQYQSSSSSGAAYHNTSSLSNEHSKSSGALSSAETGNNNNESDSTSISTNNEEVPVSTETEAETDIENDRPRFIYHAAGRCDKLVSLIAMAQVYGFTVDLDLDLDLEVENCES